MTAKCIIGAMDTYLVGGAVRDELLGLPVSDRDWVVTGTTPQALLDAGFRPVGRDFPVFLHPDTHEEHALARTERKRGHGYHGFEFDTAPSVTLEEDLSRRDLTINAIARTADGQLIDPYGGQRDLQARWLRHVAAAFAEDPLRVLRVARFAARLAHLGFRVHPDTQALMRQIVAANELEHLPAERIWQELAAALASRTPSVFVQTLRDCGALAQVLPEIDCLFGIPQVARWHPEIDTGVHTLMVLDQAVALTAFSHGPDDLDRSVDRTAELQPDTSHDPAHDTDSRGAEIRFAALCHDLGKGATPTDMLPRHHGHEERGAELLGVLCARLRVPKRHEQLATLCARWHTHAHRVDELKPATVHRLLMALDVLRKPARFEQFITVCLADARGRGGLAQAPYPQAERLRQLADALRSVDAGQVAAATRDKSQVPDRIREAQLAALRRCDIEPH